MTDPKPVQARGPMVAANDNGRPVPIGIMQALQAQHDAGVRADIILASVIEALATCTITWGCDMDQVIDIYKECVTKARGG